VVRRLFVAFALVLVLPASASAASMLLVEGRGWGHGIGLSQWGTQGFATRGATAPAILRHYYPGTTLGAAPAARVRVLVAEKGAVTVGSAGPIAVRDATGATHELEPGAYRLGPRLRLQVGDETVELTAPVALTPNGSPLTVEGKPYRGTLALHVRGSTVLAVNDVALQHYLYGVVPHEMPARWHPEALKVQAIVARTYALATRKPGQPYDLFADVRSQVYSGIAAEDVRTNAAVDATRGRVVLYRGGLASTFFFSTSGGRTAAIQDIWTKASPVPYLVARPDPHDYISPHHTWGPVAFTGAQVRAKLGLVPDDVVVTGNASGRVASVRIVGRKGGVRTVPGTEMRTELGLRSTWFTLKLLTLEAPAVVGPREAVVLRGRLRGLDAAGLHRRVGTGRWERVGIVRAGQNGRFAVRVRVDSPTTFRLAAAGRTGANVRVGVQGPRSLAVAANDALRRIPVRAR
jgi:stage II sporulation protein D